MVKITEDLIRKKAEHNECIIGTLEELSLHQENVEKIEYLNNWCKNLQILYLQSNLIAKIENLSKLKKLKYLNLAINNIEKIENLEGCESLEKLDLTLNFIGDVESVSSLKNNLNLRQLYLTGNPCVDYHGYRNYIISSLPQLENLDSSEISRSERIKAMQVMKNTTIEIIKDQQQYFKFRMEQRKRLNNINDTFQNDDEFWNAKCEHAPEVREAMAKRMRKREKNEETKEPQKPVKLFASNGKPLNINQAKIEFKFLTDDPKEYILDLAIYRYLDNNLIKVDLQPNYVRVWIKEKVFQILISDEIHIEHSSAQRSQVTGHLLIKMPKLNYKPIEKRYKNKSELQLNQCVKFTEARKMCNEIEVKRIEQNSEKDIPLLEFG